MAATLVCLTFQKDAEEEARCKALAAAFGFNTQNFSAKSSTITGPTHELGIAHMTKLHAKVHEDRGMNKNVDVPRINGHSMGA